MLRATIHRSLEPLWANLHPRLPDDVLGQAGTPDCFVVVEQDGRPALRLDLPAYPSECYAFEEALVWNDLLVVGRGHRAHLVGLGTPTVRSIDLGSYFGHLYPFDGFLLVASAQRLFRVGADGAVAWASVEVGLDGVVVGQVKDGVIEGEGEWDPPGGWRPFRISLGSGLPC